VTLVEVPCYVAISQFLLGLQIWEISWTGRLDILDIVDFGIRCQLFLKTPISHFRWARLRLLVVGQLLTRLPLRFAALGEADGLRVVGGHFW
jgi:hypothetical protein